MQKAFYYLRQERKNDNGLHPYACICVVKNEDGDIARGISVCSPNDHFSKEIARNKAFGYATKAIKSHVSQYKHSKNASKIIDAIRHGEDKFEKPVMPEDVYPQYLLLNSNNEQVEFYLPLSDFEKSILEN